MAIEVSDWFSLMCELLTLWDPKVLWSRIQSSSSCEDFQFKPDIITAEDLVHRRPHYSFTFEPHPFTSSGVLHFSPTQYIYSSERKFEGSLFVESFSAFQNVRLQQMIIYWLLLFPMLKLYVCQGGLHDLAPPLNFNLDRKVLFLLVLLLTVIEKIASKTFEWFSLQCVKNTFYLHWRSATWYFTWNVSSTPFWTISPIHLFCHNALSWLTKPTNTKSHFSQRKAFKIRFFTSFTAKTSTALRRQQALPVFRPYFIQELSRGLYRLQPHRC